MSSGRGKSAAEQFPLLEWPIPQVGTSPVTGVTGTLFWGGINKPDKLSRWVIGDSDWDDGPNFFPQQVQVQQLPYIGATVATLASSAIWMSAQVLNGNLVNFFLCQNGHIYQVTPTGTITDVYAAGTFTQTGSLINGQATITGLSSTANMFVGMLVSGTGIPANSVITIINSTTEVTINHNYTGTTGSELVTFSLPLFNSASDITNWQGTEVLFSDPVAENVYAWNGTTTLIAISGQPADYITVYYGRVWLFFGLTITWTQGGTYNSLAGDSGSAIITDAGAASAILGAISDLGVILLFGSSWIATITNPIDTGSPAVLTFQFTLLSNQVGLGSKFSILPWGNSFFFANAYGVWNLQGSNLVKVSIQLDGFFGSGMTLANSSFSGAYVVIYQQPCLIWQIYYNGDQNVAAGYTLVGCTLGPTGPNQWFRAVQGTIKLVSALPSSSSVGVPQPFGTDGTHIFPLFSSVTASYTAQLNLKIWDFYSKIDYKTYDYLFLSVVFTQPTTVTVAVVNQAGSVVSGPMASQSYSANPSTGDWINEFGVQGEWINTALTLGLWFGSLGQVYVPLQFGLMGHMRGLGLNISVTGAGLIIQAITIGYRRTTASRGP